MQLQVPVLVDGDRTLHDSWNIAEYLDEAYPDLPSLFFGNSGSLAYANAQDQHQCHGGCRSISPNAVLAVTKSSNCAVSCTCNNSAHASYCLTGSESGCCCFAGKATTRFTVHWVDQSLLKALRNIISLGAVEVSADKDKAYYRNKLETVHGVNLQVNPLPVCLSACLSATVFSLNAAMKPVTS